MAGLKNADDKRIGRLIKILLDCGINIRAKNLKGESVLDLALNTPYIILTIFDYKPIFFQNLIKDGMITEAEVIAKSISCDICVEMIDS